LRAVVATSARPHSGHRKMPPESSQTGGRPRNSARCSRWMRVPGLPAPWGRRRQGQARRSTRRAAYPYNARALCSAARRTCFRACGGVWPCGGCTTRSRSSWKCRAGRSPPVRPGPPFGYFGERDCPAHLRRSWWMVASDWRHYPTGIKLPTIVSCCRRRVRSPVGRDGATCKVRGSDSTRYSAHSNRNSNAPITTLEGLQWQRLT
jgi:hypothetical protein